MIKGRLGYNSDNDRYGILANDLWEDDGLHCGETFEVLIDDKWVVDRIELDTEWYLVYSKLRGSDLEYLQVREGNKIIIIKENIKMNFKGYEKIVLNNGERNYTFYVNEDIFNDSKNLAFLVDENDNILNAFSGRYPELYKNILYIKTELQHGAYYDIETGEQLLTEYTKKYNNNYRCFSAYNYGYVLAYNNETNMYDVFNINGEIVKSGKSFCMLNEKRGILGQKYGINNISIVDNNLNIVKENCFNEILEYNDNYIIAKEEDGKKSLYYIFDFDGNKLSKAYKTIETNDFITFKIRNKEVGSKIIKLNLEEVLGNK